MSSTDKLVQLCSDLDLSLPPRISITTRARDHCSFMSLLSDLTSCDSASLRRVVVEKQLEILVDPLAAKPLHGKFSAGIS